MRVRVCLCCLMLLSFHVPMHSAVQFNKPLAFADGFLQIAVFGKMAATSNCTALRAVKSHQVMQAAKTKMVGATEFEPHTATLRQIPTLSWQKLPLHGRRCRSHSKRPFLRLSALLMQSMGRNCFDRKRLWNHLIFTSCVKSTGSFTSRSHSTRRM